MNALIVAVDQTPAARARATTAAHLAASMNRPLHLVFGAKSWSSKTIVIGSDEYFCNSLDVADAVLADLRQELSGVTAVTVSALLSSPRAALRKEAKRLNACPVITGNRHVGRVISHLRSAERRPVFCVHANA
jgi:nucleotide-binding universal stress UspA family protein